MDEDFRFQGGEAWALDENDRGECVRGRESDAGAGAGDSRSASFYPQRHAAFREESVGL